MGEIIETDDAVHRPGDLHGERGSGLGAVVDAAVAVVKEADRSAERRRRVARGARHDEQGPQRRIVHDAEPVRLEPPPHARVLAARRAEAVGDLLRLEPAPEARRAGVLLGRQHGVEGSARA